MPLTADDLQLKFGGLPVHALIRTVALPAAKQDFEKLRAAPAVLGMHRHGMKANEFCAADQVYKAHRILPHNGVHRPTLYAVWECPRLKRKLLETAARLHRERPLDRVERQHILTAYKLQHGCVSLFRPMVAKYLYERYSRRGRVLDFCAGWGGRLLAALASPGVRSYVGIDANPEMGPVYADLVAQFGGSGKDARVLCSPAEAVDYSTLGRFDLVVTSPPYFGVEVYRHMPQYRDYEHWLTSFLFETLRRVTEHIDQDGTVCINIRQPETERRMVEEMGRLGWGVVDTLLMRLPAMPGKGSRKADAQYGEPIYVFCKAPRLASSVSKSAEPSSSACGPGVTAMSSKSASVGSGGSGAAAAAAAMESALAQTAHSALCPRKTSRASTGDTSRQ